MPNFQKSEDNANNNTHAVTIVEAVSTSTIGDAEILGAIYLKEPCLHSITREMMLACPTSPERKKVKKRD